MEKKNTLRLGIPFGRWGKRMFLGASAELPQSPARLTAKAFLGKKRTVAALLLLTGLFALVFLGPVFVPLDVNDTDPLQKNMAPTLSLLDIPQELSKNIRSVSGVSNFTVGVSRENTFYLWGYTDDTLNGSQLQDIPDQILPGKVAFASAGADHIIAITTQGEVLGWGESSSGQFGPVLPGDPYIPMPQALTVDPAAVEQLVCGNQATALLVDGTLSLWGNPNSILNLRELSQRSDALTGVKKVAFSNYYALLLLSDGTITAGSALPLQQQRAVSSVSGAISNLSTYLADKTVVDIAAAGNTYALVTADGELVVFGAGQYGLWQLPETDDRFVSVSGGSRHFAAITRQGLAYTWGDNSSTQASGQGVAAQQVFTGSRQTYMTDAQGMLVHKSGLQGYLFGTDGLGRDVFARILHGGRMTMTIGAVAVIIAAVIAVIVGCLSGYFGGWVDLLLMRVTEIFSAIPFLPFAMLLSYVIKTMPIGETQRILIIMVILGLLSWTTLARMIRSQVLAEREKEFVTAARSMGLGQGRIAFRHILPNVISVILVSITLDFAGCLLTESSLSYLGFGVQQPTPTWGNMLNGANNSVVIQSYWWQWVFPAAFLALATICINIIGDGLRDALDPKTAGERS